MKIWPTAPQAAKRMRSFATAGLARTKVRADESSSVEAEGTERREKIGVWVAMTGERRR